MTQSLALWWFLALSLSFVLVVADALTPPLILFSASFILPVLLATWYLGIAQGIGFAILLALVPWWLDVGVWHVPMMTPFIGSANFGIRVATFVVLAVLTHRTKALVYVERRVKALERLLPICSICKRIRTEDGRWEPVESYISAHSETRFSHGLCETCMLMHYPEFSE